VRLPRNLVTVARMKKSPCQ